MPNSYVLSVLVENHAGVLSRVSGLFSRRGYNIDSLTVGETHDPRFSLMTIVANGDEYMLGQMTKQLERMEDVLKVQHLEGGEAVFRELMLIKVKAEPKKRSSILEAADVFRAKVVDLSTESLIVELTGEASKLNAFVEIMQPYGILELARTGITALARGGKSLN
jgi:acetolactate synthase-1/3 small subunit